MLKDLILKNRSYRRFHNEVPVSIETLRELVDLARCSASVTNRQALKYILSNTSEKNSLIFQTVRWAGLLKDWPGPAEDERPSAYIVILLDKDIVGDAGCDHGIAAQSILLGATEKGLGGCMLGSADKDLLRRNLSIPEKYDIALVVAIGEPGEKVVLETMNTADSYGYWRDAGSVHHVPKRKLDDIIIG
ncbi:nitroreductase family protein [Chloroflexota bacterium]